MNSRNKGWGWGGGREEDWQKKKDFVRFKVEEEEIRSKTENYRYSQNFLKTLSEYKYYEPWTKWAVS